MSPEQALRAYFHAKDENRPQLLADVFSDDARLEINNRSEQISFPAVTVGREGITEVLVRRFNQTYENIHSFYLDRPHSADESFSCDWLVGMTDRESRSVRVGCGRYKWLFQRQPELRVSQLVITIDTMLVLLPSATDKVMQWLSQLDYPWTSAAAVIRTLPLDELEGVRHYLATSDG